MAHGRDVDDVGIRRVDDDPGDMVRIREGPCSSRSCRRRSTSRRRRPSWSSGRSRARPSRPRRCSDRTGPRRRRRSKAWAGRRRPARRSSRCSSSSRRRRSASRRRACRDGRGPARPARRTPSPRTRPGRARGPGPEALQQVLVVIARHGRRLLCCGRERDEREGRPRTTSLRTELRTVHGSSRMRRIFRTAGTDLISACRR